MASFFEEVGGHPTFAHLVGRFYAGVASDLDFRAMYPEDDLGPAEERLRLFLEQYWGGPNTYSERRGHPRLRMRHAPYPIDSWARDRWLSHMRVALDSTEMSDAHRAEFWEYLERAAQAMVNMTDHGDPSPGVPLIGG